MEYSSVARNRYLSPAMWNWITDIAFWDRNLICGGVGALLVVAYQLYNALPDIQANLFSTNEASWDARRFCFALVCVLLKGALSVACGGLVTALLIRPEENYGAFITGMTWPVIVKRLVNESQQA